MLTEIYIEAHLANEALADQVWQLWYLGEIDDDMAVMAWWIIYIENRVGQTLDPSSDSESVQLITA